VCYIKIGVCYVWGGVMNIKSEKVITMNIKSVLCYVCVGCYVCLQSKSKWEEVITMNIKSGVCYIKSVMRVMCVQSKSKWENVITMNIKSVISKWEEVITMNIKGVKSKVLCVFKVNQSEKKWLQWISKVLYQKQFY